AARGAETSARRGPGRVRDRPPASLRPRARERAGRPECACAADRRPDPAALQRPLPVPLPRLPHRCPTNRAGPRRNGEVPGVAGVRGPPPKIVRRLAIAPLVLLFCLAVLAFSPLLLTGALVFDLVPPRGWGGPRFAAFALGFVVTEAGMIVALFLLWLASGFGLLLQARGLRSAHYALMRGWLRCLSWAAIRLLGLRIEIVDRAAPRPGPILVFGRHAGPGNSLMMTSTLMLAYRRRPRVVMIADLQWDPVVDVMCHRRPGPFMQ